MSTSGTVNRRPDAKPEGSSPGSHTRTSSSGIAQSDGANSRREASIPSTRRTPVRLSAARAVAVERVAAPSEDLLAAVDKRQAPHGTGRDGRGPPRRRNRAHLHQQSALGQVDSGGQPEHTGTDDEHVETTRAHREIT